MTGSAHEENEDRNAVLRALNCINLALDVDRDVVEVIRRRARVMRFCGFPPVQAMAVALDPAVNVYFVLAQHKLQSVLEDLDRGVT